MKNESATRSDRRFDLIGDIHGHVDALERLLARLGYRPDGGSPRHPEGRRVIFLGDFIDRGPAIRETLHLVKSMTDAGGALAVMGNHEYNAVCFHTADGNGGYLRSHDDKEGKNMKQHATTLNAFAGREAEWDEWITWFKTLPFSLDLGGVRAVHATWSAEHVEFLKGKSLADSEFLRASATKSTREFAAIETVLKGVEFPLPQGCFFADKEGFRRPHIRVRWWDDLKGKNYREIVFPDCDTVPDQLIEIELALPWSGYGEDEAPVFFGHYWLPHHLEPEPVATNAACLDYSVAKPGGKLVAYRWDGESRIDAAKFVTEHRPPDENPRCESNRRWREAPPDAKK